MEEGTAGGSDSFFRIFPGESHSRSVGNRDWKADPHLSDKGDVPYLRLHFRNINILVGAIVTGH